MKRLDLTLLLAASLAVPLSASAQETPNALFRVAGLRVTNLLPSVSTVFVICDATTNARDRTGFVSNGSRQFTPEPLADISLGRGVISGPFEVEANHVLSSQVATRWSCRLAFSTTTSSASQNAGSGCTSNFAASMPELCPKDGVRGVTSHEGNY